MVKIPGDLQDRHAFLRGVHRAVAPGRYLEIGVQHGWSLEAVDWHTTFTLGVDPAPQPSAYQCQAVHGGHGGIYPVTSDYFFTNVHVGDPFDLVLIDGLHRFEQVVQDFRNVEEVIADGGVVLIDDVFPRDPSWATREPHEGYWTGDVWKIVPWLGMCRPELTLITVDVWPSGYVIVTGFDRTHTETVNTNPAVRTVDEARTAHLAEIDDVPRDVLDRTGAVSTMDAVQFLHDMKKGTT